MLSIQPYNYIKHPVISILLNTAPSHHSQLAATHLGIVAFDMDSTLIQCESIEELAKLHGCEKEVQRVTTQAMNGKIDFTESMVYRLKLLKGLHWHLIEEQARQTPITPGSKELITWLREKGVITALISGGFEVVASHVCQELGIDVMICNKLEVKNNMLTGRLTGNFIDGAAKARALTAFVEQFRLKDKASVAVGDGANDLPMMACATGSVSFCGKDIVAGFATHKVVKPDMCLLKPILTTYM